MIILKILRHLRKRLDEGQEDEDNYENLQNQALAQVAWGGHGVSILEDIQKLPGRCPGQPALGGLA